MTKVVLIAEDDLRYARSLRYMLQTSYNVVLARRGRTVIEEIAAHHPDLVLLNCYEECATIRAEWPNIGIVVISFETQEKTIVRALDGGADDYIVKSCGLPEVQARVHALLRRVSRQTPEPDHLQSKDGYLSLNKPDKSAYVGGKLITFTPTEFAVVWELLLHADKVLTHQALLQAVWGPEYGSESDYLRVYVRLIRCKIEVDPSNPRYLLTEPRVGYVFHNPSKHP